MGEELNARGLPATVHGIVPSLSLDTYRGSRIPTDWEIIGVAGDIIRAEFIDCTGDGDYIDRGGILLDNKVSQYTWRIAKVINVGPQCHDTKPGDLIMFPNDKGIPMTNVGGKNYIFLNEARIFAFVKPKTIET